MSQSLPSTQYWNIDVRNVKYILKIDGRETIRTLNINFYGIDFHAVPTYVRDVYAE
jgi:hypothetical protein